MAAIKLKFEPHHIAAIDRAIHTLGSIADEYHKAFDYSAEFFDGDSQSLKECIDICKNIEQQNEALKNQISGIVEALLTQKVLDAHEINMLLRKTSETQPK